MRIVDCDNNFEVKFDEWKALGYLKAYPIRRIAVFFMPDMESFVKPFSQKKEHDGMTVQEYDEESGILLDKYIENSERELMNKIPF